MPGLKHRGQLPAQMRVRVWMTIHLCSKELEDVSRMVRKISLKKTWRGGEDRIRPGPGGRLELWR